jgi:hypothetical protein
LRQKFLRHAFALIYGQVLNMVKDCPFPAKAGPKFALLVQLKLGPPPSRGKDKVVPTSTCLIAGSIEVPARENLALARLLAAKCPENRTSACYLWANAGCMNSQNGGRDPRVGGFD